MLDNRYPRPKLKVRPDKLVLDGTGFLEIRNSGGPHGGSHNVLCGSIYSTSDCIEPDSESFEGNDCRIGLKARGRIEKGTSVVVTSNGGEAVIPVFAKVYRGWRGLESGLSGFAELARGRPSEAMEFFVSEEFEQWLEKLGIKYDSMHEYFRANGKEGLESFLVFHRLKRPPRLRAEDIRRSAVQGSTEPIEGELEVSMVGWGSVSAKVRVDDAPWFVPGVDCLTEAEFEGGVAKMPYRIEPALLGARRKKASGRLLIGEAAIDIGLRVQPAFVCSVSKSSLHPGARGHISVRNNSGGAAQLELVPSEGFIRMDKSKLSMGEAADIGFSIKLSPLQAAQMVMRKRPVLAAYVDIKITQDTGVFRERVSISVSGF